MAKEIKYRIFQLKLDTEDGRLRVGHALPEGATVNEIAVNYSLVHSDSFPEAWVEEAYRNASFARELPVSGQDDLALCEYLHLRFTLGALPEGYKGRELLAGDVISITADEGESTGYYALGVNGFELLPQGEDGWF